MSVQSCSRSVCLRARPQDGGRRLPIWAAPQPSGKLNISSTYLGPRVLYEQTCNLNASTTGKTGSHTRQKHQSNIYNYPTLILEVPDASLMISASKKTSKIHRYFDKHHITVLGLCLGPGVAAGIETSKKRQTCINNM